MTPYYYCSIMLTGDARLDLRAVESLEFQRYLGINATTFLELKSGKPAENAMVEHLSHYFNSRVDVVTSAVRPNGRFVSEIIS